MRITCSQCNADVPEGAVECPRCHASINTAAFGKQQRLTKTVISKAAQVRDDIPWATTSMFVLVDDGSGKKKRRLRGWVVVAAMALALLAGAAAAWFARGLLGVRPADAVAAAQPPASPAPVVPAKPPPAKLEAAQPASAHKPAAVAPKSSASAAAAKRGTLSVDALHRGKSVPARVEVNGDDKGTTPVSVSLAPGKYTIKIEKAGFIAAKLVGVQVDPGKNTELKIDLRK